MTAQNDILETALLWANRDPNKVTADLVKSLVEETASSKASFEQLSKLFPPDGSRIGFGTAGLRAEMKPGPLGMNDLVIIQATQGLARYCKQQLSKNDGNNRKPLKAVIGYDHRENPELGLSSKVFAVLAKLVFMQAGMECILFDGFVPTPLVAFGTTYFNAAVGIMVTASHNPKKDAGYKVYWNDGCQIRPPLDEGIATSIELYENLQPWTDYRALLAKRHLEHSDNGKCFGLSNPDETKEAADKYFEAISKSGLVTEQSKIYSEETTWMPPSIAYSAMHGVGHKWAVRSFQTFGLQSFKSVPQQEDPDYNFPTVPFPNPEEKGALDIAISYAEENNCDIVLANDPDADRMAIAEKSRKSGKWKIFTGDQIGTMLGHWIWRTIGQSSEKPISMCASTVSSSMLSAIAKKEGFHFEDTLTGFKWIGSRAAALANEGYRPLFAYEEAIGFCCGDVVFDKDGVCAIGVITKLCLDLYHEGKNLGDYLQDLYSKYGEFVSQNSYYYCHDPKIVEKILKNIRNVGLNVKKVGPYEIESIRDLGYPGHDSTKPDGKPTLPTSKSSPMITLRFSNGCVAQFRASGTEPKFKYYIEMCGKPGVNRSDVEEDLRKFSDVVLEGLLNPSENGLVAP